MRNLIILFSLILFHSCSINIALYPAYGPLSESSSRQSLYITVDNVMKNYGDCHVYLKSGEYCHGQWFSSAGRYWNEVKNLGLINKYKEAFYFNIVGDENRGYAKLLGNQGTTIEIEFLTKAGTAHGFGVAKDNKNNVFKVLF
jgi:hypothetical protein